MREWPRQSVGSWRSWRSWRADERANENAARRRRPSDRRRAGRVPLAGARAPAHSSPSGGQPGSRVGVPLRARQARGAEIVRHSLARCERPNEAGSSRMGPRDGRFTPGRRAGHGERSHGAIALRAPLDLCILLRRARPRRHSCRPPSSAHRPRTADAGALNCAKRRRNDTLIVFWRP